MHARRMKTVADSVLFVDMNWFISWTSSSVGPGRGGSLVAPGQHESARRGNVTRSCNARKGPGTPMGMKGLVGSFVPTAIFMVNMKMELSVSLFQVT